MQTSTANPRATAAGNACRDRELLIYVGRQGIVSVDHVMTAMAAGRSVTYERVARCIEMGLLERHEVLRTEPSVLRATADGLRYAGLGLPVPQISAGRIEHDLRCASVALKLAETVGLGLVIPEREIAFMEQHTGKPFASAEIESSSGRSASHRADLAVRVENGELHAVEVELTPKAPRRLEEIVRAWRRFRGVNRVVYFCREGKTYRGVERAIERTQAGESVLVRKLVEGASGDAPS
ncbi:MAG TPA: hypothetical protein VK889_01510 [Solirubrobacterales bacterium]|nr:hypothetical protein [Solirubrobacterales bacterium]